MDAVVWILRFNCKNCLDSADWVSLCLHLRLFFTLLLLVSSLLCGSSCFLNFLPAGLDPCDFVLDQSLSLVRPFATPWTAAGRRLPYPSPSPRVCSNSCPSQWCHHSDASMPSRWCRLILCVPLLFLPSVFPSIRVFPSELALGIKWLKVRCSIDLLAN